MQVKPKWWIALVLLAFAQVLWAGYEWGAGNQAIQVPLLKKLIDPSLYPRDALVTDTAALYPTWFFRLLAGLVPLAAVPAVYWALHLATAAAVLAAVFLLARALTGDDWTGLVAVLLLVGGQHRSMTGEDLYLRAFTHTWATFPVAIAALVLFYRDRHLAAWAVAGALFNFHALTAVYLAALLGCGTLLSDAALPWRRRLLLPAVWLALALPTLAPLLAERQTFDAVWTGLTRIRSAPHTYLSGAWQTGQMEVPRFLLVAGAAILALGFALPDPQRRKTIGVLTGAGALLVVGWLGSSVWPVPAVLRAQLFRSSRLVLVVLVVLAAHGMASAWRLPFAGDGALGRWRRWLEFASATGLAVSLGVPALLPWLPAAVAVVVVTAVVNARLSPWQALGAGAALAGALAAHRLIAFPWWGWAPAIPAHGWLAGTCLALGLLVAVAGGRWRAGWSRRAVLGLGWAAIGVMLPLLWYQEQARFHRADPWTDVQRWARDHTSPDALFLTPIQPGGFRVESERSVVGEWRDGTQLFFAAGFAGTWWPRMTALQPGLAAAPDGGRLIAPGRPLGTLDGELIRELCRRFGATHVVLPTGWGGNLVRVYRNAAWSVYRPDRAEPAVAAGADDVAARERFFGEVVLPNIAEHRQSELTVQVVDPAGRPWRGARFTVRQVRHAFAFSGSLPFFEVPRGAGGHDYKPPAVTPAELELFPAVFNWSLIPYSGKWMYLEPEEGRREYADLDRYVGWCETNRVGMEFHFVSGYPPPWLKQKTAAEQAELFLAHARELIGRYGARIRYWQVVNEKHLLQQSPPVFREFRRLVPEARLGISDCANFYSTEPPERRLRNLCRGLDEIRWLKSQGIAVDFFGFHAHRPFGVWPDPREMYQLLDAFAAEGVKIHITEFALPLGVDILGYGPKGKWTPELQAQFYEWFFTVCFSHPAVELINLWGFGPANWQRGTGLLDDEFAPKPAYHALRKLFSETWHTEASGTLGLDGTATVRGFHGDYELVVETEEGRSARAALAIEPGAGNRYRLTLDREAGTLSRAER